MALKPLPKLDRCLAIMIRHPEPGNVKTRLSNVFDEAFVAELYGYFVDDLLESLAPGNYHREIFFTPAEKSVEIRLRFGNQLSFTPQQGEDLGERMENVFRSCFTKGFTAVLLIGSDFPDLTAEVIEEAFMALENGKDAVIGPALDGGYYLIGFRCDTSDPGIFKEMRWGGNTVREKTLNRLHARGYRVHLTTAWRDIDTGEDLAFLLARHENTPFGHSRTMTFLRNRSGGRLKSQ